MPVPERKNFLLRVDSKLWAEIEAWAEQELRSANGQIEFLLREAVRRRKNNTPAGDATNGEIAKDDNSAN